jgi:hypothetical protein
MHSFVIIVPIGIARIRENIAQIRLYVDREIEKWMSVIAAGNIKPE